MHGSSITIVVILGNKNSKKNSTGIHLQCSKTDILNAVVIAIWKLSFLELMLV